RRGELLPHEQRAARLGREVRGGEGAGPVLGFEKRRARAVDDVDRPHAAFTSFVCVSPASAARPKSCAKSSTLITLLRSASFFCHCAYSSGVIRPLSLAS